MWKRSSHHGKKPLQGMYRYYCQIEGVADVNMSYQWLETAGLRAAERSSEEITLDKRT